MSEEFTRIATQEILEDISKIAKILASCKNDDDIIHNVDSLQNYLHKIKGLAPMMNKEQVGNLASLFDSLMKQIQNGQNISGIYDSLTESIPSMKKAMVEADENLEDLQDKLSDKFK